MFGQTEKSSRASLLNLDANSHQASSQMYWYVRLNVKKVHIFLAYLFVPDSRYLFKRISGVFSLGLFVSTPLYVSKQITGKPHYYEIGMPINILICTDTVPVLIRQRAKSVVKEVI